ncbi:MAG: hypothetical protein MHPDNHAH_02120 [Anaerolineales bacterium]|nr:hypothetical protein [Anaerolineales bacterium]
MLSQFFQSERIFLFLQHLKNKVRILFSASFPKKLREGNKKL